MSWAGETPSARRRVSRKSWQTITDCCSSRIQEKCQSCDYSGLAEDWYEYRLIYSGNHRRSQQAGHVEKTNDRDYEVEERYIKSHVLGESNLMFSRRYRTMEAASMRLQKEAKGYLDSLRGMPKPSRINARADSLN